MKIIDISNCSDEVVVYINNLQNQLQQKENIIKEIYAKANDTNITSLDLRDYILKNLRGDK